MRARFTLSRIILATSVSALSALLTPSVHAGTFTWGSNTNSWSVGSAWAGNLAPTGVAPGDVLNFAGDSSTAPYTSTNNIALSPFNVNQINLSPTAVFVASTSHNISGNPLAFSGTSPQLTINGAGNVTFFTPIQIDGNLTVTGGGTGLTTANAKLSGFGNILKSGTSTFRFGTIYTNLTFPTVGPSDNTWLGNIEISAGTVRFNNNEESGRTAVRANPVKLTGVSAVFSCNSEIRCGTLSGAFGDVRTIIPVTSSASESIVITAFSDGDYAGALTLSPPNAGGGNKGQLIIRGTNTQTLSGIVNIDKDVIVGRGATLTLSGNASLGSQIQGAIVLSGGTFRMENDSVNNNNRLRDGLTTNTLEPVGGGTFILAGNAAGTQELTGRAQFGAYTLNSGTGQLETKGTGHTNIQVVHRAAANASTTLTFDSYGRNQSSISQYSTVNFSATNPAGNTLLLGQSGNNPRILLSSGTFVVPLKDELLNVTAGTQTFGTNSVGWATVTSPLTGTSSALTTVDFATHTTEGVAPVSTVVWNQTSNAATNFRVTGSVSTPTGASAFEANSVKLIPSGSGQSLNIAGSGHLNTSAILLAGSSDYTIRSTGGGGIGGAAARFFHVEKATLTVDASVAGANFPIVKSGQGVLALANATNNTTITTTTVVNGGVLRANPTTTLPGGELRLRGGIFEIQGGGTYTQRIGVGTASGGSVNWTGITATNVTEEGDRAGGGFSAFGANATVSLQSGSIPGGIINWEDNGFVRSGHALFLSSPSANAIVDLANPLSLTPFDNTEPNYNAREIRVLDNPSVSTDGARISSVISGTVHFDLLKTGDGTLELSNTNTYTGHTQVREGRLLVTGSIAASNAVVVGGTGSVSGTGNVSTILLDGGSVEPGNNGVGTLTASELRWKTGSIRVDVGAGGNQSDTLALGSGRLFKDPNGAAPYNIDFAGGGEGGRTYTLATFGTTNFVSGDFAAANLRAGLTPTFSIAGGQLQMSTNLPTAQIASQPLAQRINVGSPATLSVTTSIPGAYTYQWFKGNAPIDNATNPTYTIASLTTDDDADYHVVISNGTTPVPSDTVHITVNVAPSATPQTVEASEEIGKAFTLAGTDSNAGDTLTYSVLTLPSHGTLSGTAPNLTYTSAQDYNGPDSFTFKTRDGLLDSVPATVTINVAGVNDAPVAVTDSIVAGTATDVISNDTDIENDTLHLVSAQNGAHGTVTTSGNSVTFTPDATFTISDSFTYIVSDGNLQSQGTVNVRLANPASFGIAAKNGEVSGEPGGTLLAKLGTPTVAADGRVTFVATYTKPDRKKETSLMFGNPPVPVVRAGVTTAPNSALTFAKIGAIATNDDGDLAFKGSLTKAPAGTADGIWVISGSTTRTVAQGGMSVPGINGATFSKFGEIALPDDRRLIFAATIKGASADRDTGIWRETGSGSVTAVVREGDFIPVNSLNRKVKTLALFGPSGKSTLGQRIGFNNSGDVIARVGFDDKSSAIVRFKNDGSKEVAMLTSSAVASLGNAQFKSFGLPVVSDDGGSSVLAKLIPNVGNTTPANDVIIAKRNAAGVISSVAQEGGEAPGIVGSSFKSFSDPVGGDGDRFGFIGTLKAKAGGVTPADDTGVWRQLANGTLEGIAREGRPAPGVTNANFAAFKSLAWAKSGAAFVATLKGSVKGAITPANDTGLWVEDTDGTLRLVFQEGQSVPFTSGAKTVKTFTVLAPVLGALGQGGSTNYIGGFAILATFTDKTSGVVTTWVP